jgi:DNA end-binding protein Ku
MMAAIEQKIAGQEMTLAPPEAPKAQIIDLMEALKASLGDTDRKASKAGDKAAAKAESKAAKPAAKKKTTRKPPKRAPRKKAAKKKRAVASGGKKQKTV